MTEKPAHSQPQDIDAPGAPPASIPLDFQVGITALVHPDESGGFWAEVPALPGCITEGETLEEVRANLRDAAEGWLRASADIQRGKVPA